MKTTTESTTESEVSILTRILDNEEGELPEEVARYILSLKISDRDKARMHDLATRNREDALTPAEKKEMYAYGKAGSLVSILKSKARQRLGVKLDMTPKF
jgi:hypothetical protein